MILDWLLRRTAQMWVAVGMGLVLAWIVGALAHLSLELTLERLHFHPRSSLLIEAAVAGTVTALLVGLLLAALAHRRSILHRQLLAVAELNHQVRNALEIIASSTVRIEDKQTVITILEAVMRIDTTLRKLFPTGTQR